MEKKKSKGANKKKQAPPAAEEDSSNTKAYMEAALIGTVTYVVVAVVACFASLYIANGYTFKDADIFTYVQEYMGYFQEQTHPGATVSPQDSIPTQDIPFTVHFNGDGLGSGIATSTRANWKGLDDLIETLCPQVIPEGMDVRRCKPSNGARLYTHEGIRCYSLNDISNNMRTYVAPQGILFVWPLGEVGSEIYPKCVESPIPGKPIKLRQLSMSPRVFTVENFMTVEEMEKIIDHNKELVTPSEVGFAGWRDSTRTSSTAWDFTSWAAKKIQRRSFDIVGMPFDPKLADAVQVLRYKNPKESEGGKGEWYKPHTDWFDEKGFDGHDPTVNNGTNRFVTVFLYLSDVKEGGETVFPLSRTHEGYNGEVLTQPGTENTAGYISNDDAQWVCNSSSSALRSKPLAGNAVIFYSQGPDGSLDKLSLHGGCPVLDGEKWSANVWIWNRPKPNKKDAKDGKPKPEENNALHVRFFNTHDKVISVFWDDGSEDMVFQLDLQPGAHTPMQTYHGHRFVARDKETMEEVASWRAKEGMENELKVEF